MILPPSLQKMTDCSRDVSDGRNGACVVSRHYCCRNLSLVITPFATECRQLSNTGQELHPPLRIEVGFRLIQQTQDVPDGDHAESSEATQPRVSSPKPSPPNWERATNASMEYWCAT